MTARTLFLVAIGGALGSVLRYAFSWFIQQHQNGNFPWGTFLVNITGCLLIGFFVGWALRTGNTRSEGILFLTTGFCGGFTTFSAFSLENIHLIRNNQWQQALAYTSASLAFGLLATFVGISLVKNI